MLQELRIVVSGKVEAVVGAAAFFTGESRAGYKKTKRMKIQCFVRPPGVRMGDSRTNLIQALDRVFQS